MVEGEIAQSTPAGYALMAELRLNAYCLIAALRYQSIKGDRHFRLDVFGMRYRKIGSRLIFTSVGAILLQDLP